MQLVEYKRYMEGDGLADTRVSGYFVNWTKRYLSLRLSDRLSNVYLAEGV